MNEHADIVMLGYIHKALAVLVFIGCVLLVVAGLSEISLIFLGFFGACGVYGIGAVLHLLVVVSTAVQTNADWSRWNYQRAKGKQAPKPLGLESLKKDAS